MDDSLFLILVTCLTTLFISLFKNLIDRFVDTFVLIFFTKIEIDEKKDSKTFLIFQNYVQSHPNMILYSQSKKLNIESANYANRYNKSQSLLFIGNGNHIIKIDNSYCFLQISDSGLKKGVVFHKLSFFIFGHNCKKIEEMFKSAATEYDLKISNEILILYPCLFSSVAYCDWKSAGFSRPKRLISSVFFNSEMMTHLISDINLFLESEIFYTSRTIPHKRGYLFYGKPGNGKSSLITAIASHFNYGLAFLSLSDPSLTDQNLSVMIQKVPKGHIIVLEDIDCCLPNRDQTTEGAIKRPNSLTLSGLLNALDGGGTRPGQIIIMTTNHIEKLKEPALLRSGRIDMKFEIKKPGAQEIENFFNFLYPNEKDLAITFSLEAIKLEPSMADIQNHMLQHLNDPLGCLKNLNKMISID